MLTALRSRFIYLETYFSLAAVAEWIQTKTVNVSTYPVKFHKAINTQSHIGWRHIFSGKLSQEWLHLQEQSTKVSIGRKRLSYVWGASIIEVLLNHFILLWDLRNEGGTREDSSKTGTYEKDKAKGISTQTK